MSSVYDNNHKKAMTFFQTGNDAALKANYDYAIQMYREACKLEPDSLIFRQALRGIERRKFNDNPSKVGMLAGAKTQPIRMRGRTAKGKGKGAEALDIFEDAFLINPWDTGTARDAAEAAMDMGLKALAMWYMESVQTVANDAEFYRHLGAVYEENQAWQKAIGAWERVKKLAPNDEGAGRKINALAASATIQRAGLGESLAKNDPAAVEKKAAEERLEELKAPQFTPEERWMKEIKENPTHIGPYLQFAEHLKAKNKLDDAEKVLARGLKAVPDDVALQFTYAEIQIARLNRAIKEFEKRSAEKPDDDSVKAKLDQYRSMLLEYEIKEFKRRSALSPGESKLHHELGLRLAQAGRHKEAIASFQQARSNAQLKVEACYAMGLSFEAEGSVKLAERTYLEAVKAADQKDTETMNKLNYRLGRVSEAQDNRQAAEEYYNEVAANDYSYLDVAERLRNLS
jgi:tetratricopeptide (TPR) repeat protein